MNLVFLTSKTYCCKTNVLTKSKNDAKYWHKCQKLDTKAHIGF